MTSSVKEILAIDGLYPASFDGIVNAIKASRFDQEQSGKNEKEMWIIAVFENGDRLHFPVGAKSTTDPLRRAASIAHFLLVEHNPSFCSEC